ncbi:hypothetical protein J6590_106594, partial [Homalodisca vitripennis]
HKLSKKKWTGENFSPRVNCGEPYSSTLSGRLPSNLTEPPIRQELLSGNPSRIMVQWSGINQRLNPTVGVNCVVPAQGR